MPPPQAQQASSAVNPSASAYSALPLNCGEHMLLFSYSTHVSTPKRSVQGATPSAFLKSSQGGGGFQSPFSHAKPASPTGSSRYDTSASRSVYWNGSTRSDERADRCTVASRDGAPDAPKPPGVGAAPLSQLRVPVM